MSVCAKRATYQSDFMLVHRTPRDLALAMPLVPRLEAVVPRVV